MSSLHLTARHGAAALALTCAPARTASLAGIVDGDVSLIEKDFRQPASEN